jgi:hypothetical protein
MCQCHKSCNSFIAEDPDCLENRIDARRQEHLEVVRARAYRAVTFGTPQEIEQALVASLEYLQSLN